MTTYKGIRGLTIRTVAGDPDPLITGDIWYSTATRKIRGAKIGDGAWASGGNQNSAVADRGTVGIQTAALAMGGVAYTANAETYNGSSWTEVANLNTPRAYLGGSGTFGAGLAFAGYNAADPYVRVESETWDGSSWTEVGDLNTARNSVFSLGATNTAAVCAGGTTLTANTAVSETWNGTAWTEGNNLNTVRQLGGSAGTTTAGLTFGGRDPSPWSVNAESYDGTSWTEGANLNTGRSEGGGAGIQTSALYFGGRSAPTTRPAVTESWDDSSWTEVADLSTARTTWMSTGASNTSALAIGGWTAPGSKSQATEEWDVSAAASNFTSS